MKPVPHWFRAALGLRIGLAKLTMLDGAMIATLDADTFQRMKSAQIAYMVAVTALDEWSTRDYGFDRGGQSVSEYELKHEFYLSEWERAS